MQPITAELIAGIATHQNARRRHDDTLDMEVLSTYAIVTDYLRDDAADALTGFVRVAVNDEHGIYELFETDDPRALYECVRASLRRLKTPRHVAAYLASRF